MILLGIPLCACGNQMEILGISDHLVRVCCHNTKAHGGYLSYRVIVPPETIVDEQVTETKPQKEE